MQQSSVLTFLFRELFENLTNNLKKNKRTISLQMTYHCKTTFNMSWDIEILSPASRCLPALLFL